MGFLKISTPNIGPGGRVACLRKLDVILAVDGETFDPNPKSFYLKFQKKNSAPWLITLMRNDVIFDVLVYSPFVAEFAVTGEEETSRTKELLKLHRFNDWSAYRNFEVYRDIHKKADLVDTFYNPLTGFIAPLWMLHNRLYMLLLLVLAIYATTFFANVYIFGFTAVLIAMYTQRAQIDLKRAYCKVLNKRLWVVVAASDELSVVEKIMGLDENTSVRHFVKNAVRRGVEDKALPRSLNI
jgi:hypothetical protein